MSGERDGVMESLRKIQEVKDEIMEIVRGHWSAGRTISLGFLINELSKRPDGLPPARYFFGALTDLTAANELPFIIQDFTYMVAYKEMAPRV